MIRVIRSKYNKGAYLSGKRIDLAYRGFKPWKWTVYFSLKPVMIGSTRLYRLGPLALFVKKP